MLYRVKTVNPAFSESFNKSKGQSKERITCALFGLVTEPLETLDNSHHSVDSLAHRVCVKLMCVHHQVANSSPLAKVINDGAPKAIVSWLCGYLSALLNPITVLLLASHTRTWFSRSHVNPRSFERATRKPGSLDSLYVYIAASLPSGSCAVQLV